MTKFQPVSDYEKEKDTIFSTVSISIFAAIGINIFVTGLASSDKALSWIYIISGICIIIISLLIYWHRRKKTLTKSATLNGFFIYNSKEKEILRIPRYEMAERMWMEMKSIYDSNPELSSVWDKGEFGSYQNTSKTELGFEYVEAENDKIIRELLEYLVLHVLSGELIDLSDLDEKEVRKIKRNDVPDLLSTNRILAWLSAREESNKKYMQFLIENGLFDTKGTTLSKQQMKEMMEVVPKKPYSRFEMYLPAGGTIHKEDDYICIQHASFSIKTKIFFTGSNTVLPKNFKKWYLGIDERATDYIDYAYSVRIDVAFKWWTAFGQKYKKYYRWIDGFISRLDDLMSEETFFNTIGWETASTVLICNENQKKEEKDQESKRS